MGHLVWHGQVGLKVLFDSMTCMWMYYYIACLVIHSEKPVASTVSLNADVNQHKTKLLREMNEKDQLWKHKICEEVFVECKN